MARAKGIVIVLLILLLTRNQTIHAVNITVNERCSLVDAIIAAELDAVSGGCPAGNGADTIELSGNTTLSTALWNIQTTVTVNGNGHSVNRNGANADDEPRFRIFEVAGGSLTINDLTMTDGWHNQNGGAILLTSGALTLNNCTISNSHSANEGGAIYGQNGHITINYSSFSDNSSYGNGGAISFSATSSDEQWSVQITGSTFDRNSTEGEGIAGSVGGEGGAIYLNGGNVSISASSFSRNTASKQGWRDSQ